MQQPIKGGSHMQRSVLFLAIGCSVIASLALVVMSTSSTRAEEPAKVELKLDPGTAVVLKKEVNGMPANTKLISTPSFVDYTLDPVVDGIKKRKELGWQECSWASEENGLPHGIEIQFGMPQRGGRFQVTWAYDIYNADGGKWWISRDYVIQVKEKAADEWKTVFTVKNNQSVVGCYPLPNESIGFLRIYQLPGGGHPERSDIMWVGQVELLD